jgi:hypothetical protein
MMNKPGKLLRLQIFLNNFYYCYINMSPKGSERTLPLEFTFDFNASGESTIRFPVEDGGLPPLSQVRSRVHTIICVTKYTPG